MEWGTNILSSREKTNELGFKLWCWSLILNIKISISRREQKRIKSPGHISTKLRANSFLR